QRSMLFEWFPDGSAIRPCESRHELREPGRRKHAPSSFAVRQKQPQRQGPTEPEHDTEQAQPKNTDYQLRRSPPKQPQKAISADQSDSLWLQPWRSSV